MANRDFSAVSRQGTRRTATPAGSRPSFADLALISQLLDGDEAAFEGLVGQYHGRLLRLATCLVSKRPAAEKVVQDSWRQVLTELGSIRKGALVKTWLFGIVVHRAKEERGSAGLGAPCFVLVNADGAGPTVSALDFRADGRWAAAHRRWDECELEKLELEPDTMARVERALGRLPAAERAVVTLRDVEGLAPKETCDLLEISDDDCRRLLQRGRSEIRRALGELFDGHLPGPSGDAE